MAQRFTRAGAQPALTYVHESKETKDLFYQPGRDSSRLLFDITEGNNEAICPEYEYTT